MSLAKINNSEISVNAMVVYVLSIRRFKCFERFGQYNLVDKGGQNVKSPILQEKPGHL